MGEGGGHTMNNVRWRLSAVEENEAELRQENNGRKSAKGSLRGHLRGPQVR